MKHLRLSITGSLLMSLNVVFHCLASCFTHAAVPVRFQPTIEKHLLSQKIGVGGGVLKCPEFAGLLAGCEVIFPPKALEREVEVILTSVSGKLPLRDGTPSGAYLRLQVNGVTQFHEPVVIRISYETSTHQKQLLVGYAVDDVGELASVDLTKHHSPTGKAEFSTWVPLLFTWVYVSQ